MTIEFKEGKFGNSSEPKVMDPDGSGSTPTPNGPEVTTTGSGILAAALGIGFSSCFYALVWFIPWGPMQRYFLGHPIAAATTVLFWFAVAVLLSKWLGLIDQSNRLMTIRDPDLLPAPTDASPAGRWLEENDAGHVARRWLLDLGRLPAATRNSQLVRRLEELLTRQSQRGTAKHLADDLRELSGRDADAAHDSLGLVRIIIWAIPMLGFLGTVIGITQTLGGLDFTNGSAAVDNLKSGLYVAFDTTALGLVLSVVAIFLQFPVERREQRLLASIDARVGHLVSACLPSDEASDNQTVLIADLCKGVQAAVAESLDNQAKLWRETIDVAQNQWQSNHDHNTNRLAEAFQLTLVPALIQHAESLDDSSRVAGDRLSAECQKWQSTLEDAHQRMRSANESTSQTLTNAIDEKFGPALNEHAASLDQSAKVAADRMQEQWQQWQQSIQEQTAAVHQQNAALASQQQSLAAQQHAWNETLERADAFAALQKTLDANLQRLHETNCVIDESINAAAGNGMADAMRILARAVDVLSVRLSESSDGIDHLMSRRAA